LLVLLLLPIELLLARDQASRLLLDFFVATLDPSLQLLPLAFCSLELPCKLATDRFELLGLLGDFGERLAIVIGQLGANHRNRTAEAGRGKCAR
jgi:hypothetical protein